MEQNQNEYNTWDDIAGGGEKKMLTKQWIRTAKEMIVMHQVTNTKTTTTNTKRPANNKWEQKQNSLPLNIGTICWIETLNEQRNARTTKDKHHFHIILQIDLCITYAHEHILYIIYTHVSKYKTFTIFSSKITILESKSHW